MSTFADSVRTTKVPWAGISIAFLVALLLAVVSVPDHLRSRAGYAPTDRARPQLAEQVTLKEYAPAAFVERDNAVKAPAAPSTPAPDAAAGRKIIRTGSLEMVVQHPAEVADRLTALAESMGGYLVSADGGGQNATTGIVTIRVPAARFEEARAEIHKMGLRVESEKIDAQDVTRQYVDQDANLRNLHAEEAQYLAILKQASTVKDLLLVSERLSQVRGQIEQQQAEFNALSQQIDTVALTISLHTEAEAQTFGLNWRPGYQLKVALRDGLDGLATYATVMTAILLYLPVVLLWVGTILIGTLISWKTVRWIGQRWFGWGEALPHA